jgi:PAS domain S-box-containing protein
MSPGLGTAQTAAVLDAIFDQAPVGLAFWDRELRFVRINDALAEINGLPAEEHLGRRLDELLPDLPEAHQLLCAVLESGEPVIDREVRGRTHSSGEGRVWRASYFPVREGEETAGVCAIVTEVTDEHRAAEAQRQLQADVSRANSTLTQVIERVPVAVCLHWGPEHRFAFVNRLYHEVIPDRGEVLGRPVLDVFPDQEPIVREMHDQVLATGRMVEIEDYPVPFPDDPRSFEGHRHYTATLVRVPGSSSEDAGVLVVLRETTEEVARRRSLERELAEEHEIAYTLQRSLLPTALPELPELELAVRFRAAGERHEVGGDFYDVYRTVAGTWLMVLGDVCGKGPEAAGLTALVRHTLRTAAMFTADLPQMLSVLNEALMRGAGNMRYATAVLACLDLSGDHPCIEVSSAGHPPALLAGHDGSVREVGGTGMLLGVSEGVEHGVERVELCPGDLLFLYTDGVIEAGAPHRFLEPDQLQALVATRGDEPADSTLARVEATVAPSGSEPRDDMAMLALRRPIQIL